MILCKGNGCNWKKTCSRYVIGKTVADMKPGQLPKDEQNTWIDHCLHASKFNKMC